MVIWLLSPTFPCLCCKRELTCSPLHSKKATMSFITENGLLYIIGLVSWLKSVFVHECLGLKIGDSFAYIFGLKTLFWVLCFGHLRVLTSVIDIVGGRIIISVIKCYLIFWYHDWNQFSLPDGLKIDKNWAHCFGRLTLFEFRVLASKLWPVIYLSVIHYTEYYCSLDCKLKQIDDNEYFIIFM